MGIFARILLELVSQDVETGMIMIDVAQLVRHRSENRLRRYLKAPRKLRACGKKGAQSADRADQRWQKREVACGL